MFATSSDVLLISAILLVFALMILTAGLLALCLVSWVRHRQRLRRHVPPEVERRYIRNCFPDCTFDFPENRPVRESAPRKKSVKVKPLKVRVRFRRPEWKLKPAALLRHKVDWN